MTKKINPPKAATAHLLLQAAVLNDERAVQAWRSWRPLVNENDLDEGSHRLLPLLHQNLTSLGVNPAELEKYKQVQRFYWYKNQYIISKLNPLLQRFTDEKIEFLLIKGIPFAFHFYPNQSIRPFNDADILVRPNNALRAYELLEEAGFQSQTNYPKEKVFLVRNSNGFKYSTGIAIDLHWDLFSRTWGDSSPLSFWEHPIRFDIGQIELLTMNTTYHLWHACIHGVPWSSVAPIRWAADSSMLLRNHGQKIDWDLLIKTSAERKLSLQLHKQLVFLKTELDLHIPPGILAQLASVKPWRWENTEMRLITKRPRHWKQVTGFWFLYLRKHSGNILKALITFPSYLSEHIFSIRPSVLIKKLSRRIQNKTA